MTMIVVDPNELATVAATLRTVASAVAEVGTQLSCGAQCAMPPQVESLVNQIVATSDAVLDEVARRLAMAADGLGARSNLAANDSLTAASAATGVGLTAASSASGAGLYPAVATIGGTDMVISYVGGGPGSGLNDGVIITAPDGTDLTNAPPSTVISYVGGEDLNGGVIITAPDGTDLSNAPYSTVMSYVGGGSLGPTTGGATMGDAIMALARTSDNMQHHIQAGIDAMVSNPNLSPQGARVAMNLQSGLGDAQAKLFAPSRDELSASRGYEVSLADFHAEGQPGYDSGLITGYSNPLAIFGLDRAPSSGEGRARYRVARGRCGARNDRVAATAIQRARSAVGDVRRGAARVGRSEAADGARPPVAGSQPGRAQRSSRRLGVERRRRRAQLGHAAGVHVEPAPAVRAGDRGGRPAADRDAAARLRDPPRCRPARPDAVRGAST